MNSVDIARDTGKRHGNVMANIRNLNVEYEESTYLNLQNRKQPCLLIDDAGYAKLMLKYEIGAHNGQGVEKGALFAIEQVLGIQLHRGFPMGKYRLDGFDAKSNTAYEIDEAQHKSKEHAAADDARDAFILEHFKTKTIRIKCY